VEAGSQPTGHDDTHPYHEGSHQVTFEQAADLTKGSTISSHDETWTLLEHPIVHRAWRFLYAELRGPAGQRSYLTEHNVSSFAVGIVLRR
jgi:hypothetical protein